jgi:hypothetical protein
LENLNVTLRRINSAKNSQTLKVTIRLGEDYNETRRFLEQNARCFSQLALRDNSLAFRLATYFQRVDQPVEISQIEILICSTISEESDTEIRKLPKEFKSIERGTDDSHQFSEVGHLMPITRDFRWSVFGEVRTNELEWLGDRALEDFIE